MSNQQATLATRKDKDEPPYHELIAHWQDTLKDFDVSTASLKQAKGNAHEMGKNPRQNCWSGSTRRTPFSATTISWRSWARNTPAASPCQSSTG